MRPGSGQFPPRGRQVLGDIDGHSQPETLTPERLSRIAAVTLVFATRNYLEKIGSGDLSVREEAFTDADRPTSLPHGGRRKGDMAAGGPRS